MAYVAASIEIPTDPDSIWAVIGPFGSIGEWLPGFGKAELRDGGRVRRLQSEDGGIFLERLVTYDEPGRSCSYTITQAPVEIADHLAVIRVHAVGNGRSSRVDWTAAFTVNGNAHEITKMIQGLFDDGLIALKSKF